MDYSIRLFPSGFETMKQRVSSKHGWCKVFDLSGAFEENIFMAVFADDSRILFEIYSGLLTLLPTSELSHYWFDAPEDEKESLLEEILVFYHMEMPIKPELI